MIHRPVNIYEVKCERCGGFIGMQTDNFRHETDPNGKQRYFHIPDCPVKGEKSETPNGVKGIGRSTRVPLYIPPALR